MQARHIQQFARCAIRFAGIKNHPTFVTHHFGDGLRQLADSAVNARADINVRQHRLGVLQPDFMRQLHHMNARRRHIIDVQKFAHRRTAAPHHHVRRILCRRLVEATQQCWDHMRVTRMEVVVRPVQVGRHDRAVIASVLAVVRFAQFDPGDFGNGVRLVGRLQRTLQ
ncbi:hypothetical protein ExPUPEC87_01535 [Escherichia coli]|nr:hypothetical protein ExPUPEC87_01535 [Escherichia coli]